MAIDVLDRQGRFPYNSQVPKVSMGSIELCHNVCTIHDGFARDAYVQQGTNHYRKVDVPTERLPTIATLRCLDGAGIFARVGGRRARVSSLLLL